MNTRYILNIQLFSTATIETGNTLASTNPTYLNTNTTGSPGLSAENRKYYNMTLIDEAGPKLVHWQGGQKKPIPQRNGKTINFRRFEPWAKALTPLTEGITPNGTSNAVNAIEATVSQYGNYATLSDILDLTAIDDNVLQTVKLAGDNAGLTIDTIVRNIINAGTNVFYAPKVSGDTETEVTSRVGLDTSAELTVDVVNTIVANMRANNVPTIDGFYHAIIHPYAAYSLMKDPLWKSVKAYSDPSGIYAGEIGEIGGVRFLETSEAKIFEAKPLTAASHNLTVKTNVSGNTSVPVKEKITSDDVSAFAARSADDKKVYIGGVEYTVSALVAGNAGSASITLSAAASVSADAVIAGTGSSADGYAVFSTLFYGNNAYGVTEIEGGGIETIIKQRGSAGTADPLDQRSTVGWKGTATAVILSPKYLVRCESKVAKFNTVAKEN